MDIINRAYRIFARKDGRKIGASGDAAETATTGEEPDISVVEGEAAVASQWRLMWWRFRDHKLAMVGMVLVILMYLSAIFAEFVAPYDPLQTSREFQFAPPQLPRFVDVEGQFHLRPFVYQLEQTLDLSTGRRIWTAQTDTRLPISLFVQGSEYEMLNTFPARIRLFGVREGIWYPLGGDRMGRDLFSRIIFGTRISTSIGLIGVFLSLVIGILLGGISGYFGGMVDHVIQRVIETLMAIPTLPLWMALSAAMPPWWPQTTRYFVIVVILAIQGWTGVARQTRGKFLSVREEDYIMAAQFLGASSMRIIVRHMLPGFMSHIIATASLAIPAMILGETALSFLGLGLQLPTISWGVLLQQAQNIQSVALYPWLLLPGLTVTVVVLAFNFVGDGLRDAADPYA